MGSTIGRQSMGDIAVTHLAFYSGWPTAASAANLLKQLEESSCP